PAVRPRAKPPQPVPASRLSDAARAGPNAYQPLEPLMPPPCTPAPMLPRRKVLATALLLSASPALPAPAPTAAGAHVVGFDTVVVTSAGFDQKITAAPASISGMTREELERKQFGNLAEALGEVEGVDIGQGTGKTGGLVISIRGMPSAYTLVLIDGRRQNNGG